MITTLKDLCLLNGVSSGEAPVRAYLQEKAAPFVTNMRVDTLGNLIVFKKGTKSTGNKLMLTAHMDEVGFIVTHITDEGYLKFESVGGIDRRVVIGKRVTVGEAQHAGVIGLKAYHMVSAEEEKITPKMEDMYIDIGAKSKDAALEKVAIGDLVAFDSDVVHFGDGMIKAKAIDDRLGCAIMLELLRQDLPIDCTFVFSVQEEVGLRGAFGAAFSVNPEIALVLEGTTSADMPSVKGHRKVTAPGQGPVLGLMDGSTVYDRGLFELLRDLAEEAHIPWQTKRYVAGGTDAAAIQRTKKGVRVASISAAVRYLHTPSCVASLRDCEQMYDLAMKFIEAVGASCEE